MHELKDRDTWRLSDLFEDLRYNLLVDSIIAGNTPAWVYVDDVSDPRTGWMWNRMDTMLLAGRTDNRAFNEALSALLTERVIPDARGRRVPSLTLHYSPDAWEDEVDRLLPDMEPRVAWRRFYEFDRLKVDWREACPADCDVRCIDEALLENERLRNVERVVGWVLSFWRGIEAFTETGFGFCVVHGEAVASWCLTVYASGGDVELGLATVPDYRSRGYATLAAAACVEHGVERTITPHWHCDEENLPSIRVAEKVGFSNPTRYKVYTFAL